MEAAGSKAPPTEVRRLVEAVLRSLADAAKAGPKSPERAVVVQARVVADLLDRTPAQYSVSIGDKALEPYLDGLGFAVAARKEAERVLPQLRRLDKKKAEALETAVNWPDGRTRAFAGPILRRSRRDGCWLPRRQQSSLYPTGSEVAAAARRRVPPVQGRAAVGRSRGGCIPLRCAVLEARID